MEDGKAEEEDEWEEYEEDTEAEETEVSTQYTEYIKYIEYTEYVGRIQRKTFMVCGTLGRSWLYNLALYVYSRVESHHIYHGHSYAIVGLNPMPESSTEVRPSTEAEFKEKHMVYGTL